MDSKWLKGLNFNSTVTDIQKQHITGEIQGFYHILTGIYYTSCIEIISLQMKQPTKPHTYNLIL